MKGKTPILLYRGHSFNSNFYYFSGADVSNAFLLIRGKKKTLLVSELEERGARKEFSGRIEVLDDFYPWLKDELKGRKVKVDGDNLPAKIYERLSRFCNPTDASAELFERRRVKKPGEVEKIRRAVRAANEIIDSLDVTKDMTENQVKTQIKLEILENGLEPAFEPIVASGPNTAVPHHASTNRKISEFALIDLGVKVDNYGSDLTRCFSISFSKESEREVALYQKLHQVFDLIIDEIPSLETGKELAEFSNKVMKLTGLPKMIHAIGHGVGLDIHEFPRLSMKYEDRLAGTVFALEPAVYFKTYGARYEETVYYDGKKVRIL